VVTRPAQHVGFSIKASQETSKCVRVSRRLLRYAAYGRITSRLLTHEGSDNKIANNDYKLIVIL